MARREFVSSPSSSALSTCSRCKFEIPNVELNWLVDAMHLSRTFRAHLRLYHVWDHNFDLVA